MSGKGRCIINLAGMVFGRLTVHEMVVSTGRNRIHWRCGCVCGNEVVVNGARLRNGQTRSCGCYKREVFLGNQNHKGNKTHGKSSAPVYRIWRSMLSRCENRSVIGWSRYGGRGITVCERWNKFENFLEDMGPRPDGMSLDRIDNNGHYEPENCRWATRHEQARNKRNNHLITCGGETKCLAEWSIITGLKQETLRRRVKLGWPAERVIQSPLRGVRSSAE